MHEGKENHELIEFLFDESAAMPSTIAQSLGVLLKTSRPTMARVL
jgi:hypothetical protein